MMDDRAGSGAILPAMNDEWTAERVFRLMRLPYGAAGRSAEELRTCPHCERTYYLSNGGRCPRCGGPVPCEPPRATTLHFGLG
ncbi:MAG: hypothetical protein U0531_02065 [Dehalococcoidia bacterium]